MSYKRTLRGVDYLIDNELDMARDEHGATFASMHEGFAVIKEEADEACDDLGAIKLKCGAMWQRVKNDDYKSASKYAEDIASCAERLACEAIQVAAMALKFVDTVEEGED